MSGRVCRWVCMALCAMPWLLCAAPPTIESSLNAPITQPIQVGLMVMPPFFDEDASQTPPIPHGLLFPVLSALMSEVGMPYQVTLYPPPRLYRNLISGESHMTVAIAAVPEISDYMLPLDQPIAQMSLNLYWLADSPPLQARPAPEWWHDKSICRVRGYSFAGMVRQLDQLADPPQWHITKTRQQALRLLVGRRCQYLLDYDLPLQQAMTPMFANEWPALAHQSLRTVSWQVMVSANAPNAVALLDRLRAAQSRLQARGEMQHLLPRPLLMPTSSSPAAPGNHDLP